MEYEKLPLCECIAAPMGRGGLEGFVEGTEYRYEHCHSPKEDKFGIPRPDGGTHWYRVYHSEDYYETCNPGIFKQHFKEITQ
jgi:hypothetical protein